MTAYPVLPVVLPSVLDGQENGRLNPAVLEDIPGGQLVQPAARAWRALSALALAAGYELRPVSQADAYRRYAVQETIFRQRYSPTPLAGRPTKTWNGATWWKREGVATAAVPGTSNHGWGLAVDAALVLDGQVVTISTDPDGTGPMASGVAWLLATAPTYGWSWETVPEEPWHIRYVAGDRIPAAVLGFEMPALHLPDPQEDDMTAARIVGFTEFGNRWLVGTGPALNLSGELYASLREGGVPEVVGPTHAAMLKGLLEQSGLTQADLVAA